MNAFTRGLVIALAVVGLATSVVVALRAVVLAGGGDVTWSSPEWYRDLLAEGSWSSTGLAGVVCIAIAVVCLVAALWVVVPPRRPARSLELGGDDARVTLPLEVLERLSTRVATAELAPEVQIERVRVTRREGRLVTRTRLSATPTDFIDLQARLFEQARRDLGGATGLEVDRLVLEIARLITPGKGSS